MKLVDKKNNWLSMNSNIYNAQQNYCVFIIFDNFLGLIAISNILKQSDAFLQSFYRERSLSQTD